MEKEIAYMLGVIAVGFIVNYALRALPFLLFAGRDRELPRWVERLGNVISPVIICGLIAYSYSGLEWKTAYPYLAGAAVVGLQVWKRNPLASIVAGTVLYMVLLNCGCTTQRTLEMDAQNPAVRITTQGVFFDDQPVQPTDVPEILEDFGVPHDRAVHILLDPDVKDLRLARFQMAVLSKSGYTRPVLVTKRHAESVNLGKRKPAAKVSTPRAAPRKIRYKKAND